MASDKPGTAYSEPEFARSKAKELPPFFIADINHKIVPETRELLKNYSHVPVERQSEHVHKIRDEAWKIRGFPCIGLGSWLVPQLCRLPIYSEVLKGVKDNGATLVDIGTFIGHDLRKLVYDGAPSDKLYGIDIVSYVDVSYDFFRDRERYRGHFIEGDIFSLSHPESPELSSIIGQTDFVLVSQLLHLWNWDGQVKACISLTALTKPGSLVLGNQIANPESQEIFMKIIPEGVWRHNSESFARMWDQVGAATGTRWETQGWLRSFAEMGWEAADAAWMEPGVCILEFVAKRTL